MEEYEALKTALNATGIPFAEDGWDTDPGLPYGVYAIDSGSNDLWAEDRLISQGLKGTVDLFTGLGAARVDRSVIEAAIEQSGLGYRFNYQRYESGATHTFNSRHYIDGDRLMHYEWIFWLINDREV